MIKLTNAQEKVFKAITAECTEIALEKIHHYFTDKKKKKKELTACRRCAILEPQKREEKPKLKKENKNEKE